MKRRRGKGRERKKGREEREKRERGGERGEEEGEKRGEERERERKNYFSIFLTFEFWGGSMAGENIQFEEIKINCVQNFKKREYMHKKLFLFFLEKKNYFSIFLTFGFWGGSMAGENVEFEEG